MYSLPLISKKKGLALKLNLFTSGVPETIRTSGPQIRNLLLYPTELRGQVGIIYIKESLNATIIIHYHLKYQELSEFEQRENLVFGKPVTSMKKFQFGHKAAFDEFSAHNINHIDNCLHGSSRSQQVVGNNNPLSLQN